MQPPLGRVVLEGRFRKHGLIRRPGSGFKVSGSATVQVVQRSDGSFVLRLSQYAVSNPEGVRLRLYLHLRDPMGGNRSIKHKWMETFADPLWLDACGSGQSQACNREVATANSYLC